MYDVIPDEHFLKQQDYQGSRPRMPTPVQDTDDAGIYSTAGDHLRGRDDQPTYVDMSQAQRRPHKRAATDPMYLDATSYADQLRAASRTMYGQRKQTNAKRPRIAKRDAIRRLGYL